MGQMGGKTFPKTGVFFFLGVNSRDTREQPKASLANLECQFSEQVAKFHMSQMGGGVVCNFLQKGKLEQNSFFPNAIGTQGIS